MAKVNVKFTKDNEYYTPKSVVEYFEKFDYDPATCYEKAKEFGIKNYDTIETNGLTKDWTIYKNIWINPPFTDKHKFLEKAYQTYKDNWNKLKEYIRKNIIYDDVGMKILDPSPLEDYMQELQGDNNQ